MCGFAGQWNPQRTQPERVARAAKLLHHRGPDDSGDCTAPHIAFAFRRLSILDVSPAGHQPMASGNGKLHVMHNGEIYNYLELREELKRLGKSFQTETDTEVVLAAYEAWGTDCFAKFNGMWAIALWDASAQTLVLSRDRFGEKPLYYADDAGGIVFGSEIKAVLAQLPKTPPPNDTIVFDYLAYAFHDHTEETFFSGIKQVLPGTMLIAHKARIRIERYWQLQPGTVETHDAAERFRELLMDSIRIRLRSDVPVGTCLSGGLDSSAIALLARKVHDPSTGSLSQKTFTAYADDARYDERRFSRMVNERIGAEAHEVAPLASEFPAVFPRLLEHQEEPFLSMSIFAQWKVMETAKTGGVTVLLDGQGGDEILAGYIPFFASLFADEVRHGRFLAFASDLRAFLRRHRASLFDILPTFALYLLPNAGGRVALSLSRNPALVSMRSDFRKKQFRYPDVPRPFSSQLKNHMHRLLTTTGVRALLHYEDRNAMAFSLESRVPFLDHRLAELTLSLPDAMLIGQGEAKKLLRAALKDVLPEPIRNRHEKMGFVVPQAEWMRGELRQRWQDALLSPNTALSRYIDSAQIEIVSRKFLMGDSSSTGLLWRWYNLESWLEHFHA